MSLPKYQIFVSSTFVDLRQERDQVFRTVLKMGHLPVGMELFSAADQEQWEIISRYIDQSDYYVVVIAHRYGSVTQDERSYTEKEYDCAVAKGIPVLGFIIADGVSWLPERIDSDDHTRKALASFKDKAKKKPVGFWKSADDLGSKVAVALVKQFHLSPRPGYVRASASLDGDVAAELARLSSENARLRMDLEAARQEDTRKDIDVLEGLLAEGESLPRKPGGSGYTIVDPARMAGWLASVRHNLAETFGRDSPFCLSVQKEKLMEPEFVDSSIRIVCDVVRAAVTDLKARRSMGESQPTL